MRHVIPTLILGLMSLFAFAAPVPKALKAKADYFPLALGDRWEYESNSKGDRSFNEVTAVTEQADGSRTVEVTENYSGKRVTTYRVANGRIHQVSSARSQAGDEVMRTELKGGESWTTGDDTYRVGDLEEVTVPAGKFSAFRVERTSARGQTDASLWYANGVGFVRSEFGAGNSKTVWGLKLKTNVDSGNRQ